MLPVITIFGRDFSTYAIMATIGILASLFFVSKTAPRFKLDSNNVIILLLISAIGVVAGGHLLYGLTNIDKIIYLIQHLDQITSFKILFDSLFYIFGGQVFYGGLIGGLIAGFIYLKIKKWDACLYSYVITPVIPLFHVFGRIGCFLGGCCYGVEMEHGITYHNSPIPTANDVPRLPIQLIEANLNLLLFIILYYLQRHHKCKNTLMYVYLIGYSSIRFTDEFFRGDAYRGFIGPLSTSQVISIIIFVFATLMIIHTKNSNKNTKR